MPRPPDSHPQTLAVLGLLADAPDRWWYGYDIARRTGLRSGTLYPLLVRLAERGYLDARWEPDPPEGRPRRHHYRLTEAGAVKAAEAKSIEAKSTEAKSTEAKTAAGQSAAPHAGAAGRKQPAAGAGPKGAEGSGPSTVDGGPGKGRRVRPALGGA